MGVWWVLEQLQGTVVLRDLRKKEGRRWDELPTVDHNCQNRGRATSILPEGGDGDEGHTSGQGLPLCRRAPWGQKKLLERPVHERGRWTPRRTANDAQAR
jgi:hypothetical protein